MDENEEFFTIRPPKSDRALGVMEDTQLDKLSEKELLKRLANYCKSPLKKPAYINNYALFLPLVILKFTSYFL